MGQITIAVPMALFVVLQTSAGHVDIRGAGVDNQEALKNTKIMNNMINHLNKTGRDTFFFPSGDYLTVSVHMKSNITLKLGARATLRFSDNFDGYMPFVEMRYEGIMIKSFQPLIYTIDAENITIEGRRKLSGQGKAWWKGFFWVLIDLCDNDKCNVDKYQPFFEQTNDAKALYAEANVDRHSTLDRRFLRPPSIQLLCYRNIRIEGITIVNSSFQTVNPSFCDNVTVKGVTINNVPSLSTDGINPESYSDVHISDYHTFVGDDRITIKDGRNLQAREIGRPCESITVTNCMVLSRYGGVVIGGETSEGVKKVTISNCIFNGIDHGIRIESTCGCGGVVEDIRVSNAVMNDIKREAAVLNLRYSQMKMEKKGEHTPVFCNIFVTGLTVHSTQTPLKVDGLPEVPTERVVFRDIYVNGAKKECLFRDCKDLVIDDVYINGEKIKYEK